MRYAPAAFLTFAFLPAGPARAKGKDDVAFRNELGTGKSPGGRANYVKGAE